MFTGLVAEVGEVAADPSESPRGGRVLSLRHSSELSARLEIGASLAVSGTCLTLIEHRPGESVVEMSEETLRLTTLGALRSGARVNLEAAMRMGDPMGGHWVQGHVDGTTEVTAVTPEEEFSRVAFALPAVLGRYFVTKGSVTIDGVSLTVAEMDDDEFAVALIPHTLSHTTLGQRRPGDRVNVEVDVLAKYVERSVAAWRP